MIQINLCSEYRPVLAQLFSEDAELLNTYHIIAGQGLDACVEHTASALEKDCGELKFNVMYKDGNLIGYFGLESTENNKFLTGFFVRPQYRNKKVLSQVWETINVSFEKKPFISMVYSKNTRATKFLSKCGGRLLTEFNSDLGKVSMFGFNKE